MAEKYINLSYLHKDEFTTYGTMFTEVDELVSKIESHLPYEEVQPEEYWNVWNNMEDHTPYDQIPKDILTDPADKETPYDKSKDLTLL
jgi:hypothetical protein